MSAHRMNLCPTCGVLSATRYCSAHTPDWRSPSSRVTGTSRFQKLRLRVLKDAGYRCRYCGGEAAQVDHVHAVSRGGDHYDTANLVAACAVCNGAKGAKAA